MDINGIFGWSKISNDTAPMDARRFWTYPINWIEVIFNRLSSSAAKKLLPD